MRRKSNPDLELSRILTTAHIPAGGVEEKIVARHTECEAIARRLGLEELSFFEAKIDVDHERDGLLLVSGSFTARFVHRCVVSLELFEDSLSDTFEVLFAPPKFFQNKDHHHIDEADGDVPEPIEDGQLDLGEIAVQHFSLRLDPYPRKKGAQIPQKYLGADSDDSQPKTENPFQKLSSMVNVDDQKKGKN